MGRKKKNAILEDVDQLIRMLQKEWECSKEAVRRVEVPPCIIKACNKELEGMAIYLNSLSEDGRYHDTSYADGEELPLFRAVYATKDAYVLMRVARKLLDAFREMPDRKKLVVTLDEDEYRKVVTRFQEYVIAKMAEREDL